VFKTSVKIVLFISDDVYGCDNCRKKIDIDNNSKLDLSLHYHSTGAEFLHFCCWKCVIDYLKKLIEDKNENLWFVSLPFLHFDAIIDELSIKDFLKLFEK